jgi:hypothetical protein
MPIVVVIAAAVAVTLQIDAVFLTHLFITFILSHITCNYCKISAMSQSREIEKRINFKGKSNSHNTLNAAKMHSMSTTGKMFSLGSILFGVICFALCFLVAVIPVIISTDVSNYYQRFSVGLYSVVIPPEAEGIEPYQIMNVFGMLVIILGGLCLICAVPGIVINALTKTKFYIIPVALTLGSVLFMVAISFSATMDPQVITDNAGDINWMRD